MKRSANRVLPLMAIAGSALLCASPAVAKQSASATPPHAPALHAQVASPDTSKLSRRDAQRRPRTTSKPPRRVTRAAPGRRPAPGRGIRGIRARTSAAVENVPSRSAPYATCLEFLGRYYVVVYAPTVSASAFSNRSVVNGNGTGRTTGTQRIGWQPMLSWLTTAGWAAQTSNWWFGHDGTAVGAEGWGYWAAPPAPMRPFIGNSLFTGNYASHTFVVPGRGWYWVGQDLYWASFPGAVSTDFADRHVVEWNYQVRC
jgi:hypothetical protein